MNMSRTQTRLLGSTLKMLEDPEYQDIAYMNKGHLYLTIIKTRRVQVSLTVPQNF